MRIFCQKSGLTVEIKREILYTYKKRYKSTSKNEKETLKMKEFKYVVTDPEGIHARPAGLLVKKAAEFKCKVTIDKAGRAVDLKRILGVMGLGVKAGEEVTISADGEDEAAAIEALEAFMKENL